MAKIIKQGAIVEDNWQVVRLAPGESADSVALPAGELIVPLAVWQAQKPALQGRSVGVWLDGSNDPAAIADELPAFALVAVDFPKFADGRGYSIAALLRSRYGYTGELRAIGDVLKDQLFYLKRVGFDAFAVRADKNIDDALTGLQDFSEVYQASVDQALPIFRRHARGLAA